MVGIGKFNIILFNIHLLHVMKCFCAFIPHHHFDKPHNRQTIYTTKLTLIKVWRFLTIFFSDFFLLTFTRLMKWSWLQLFSVEFWFRIRHTFIIVSLPIYTLYNRYITEGFLLDFLKITRPINNIFLLLWNMWSESWTK